MWHLARGTCWHVARAPGTLHLAPCTFTCTRHAARGYYVCMLLTRLALPGFVLCAVVLVLSPVHSQPAGEAALLGRARALLEEEPDHRRP